MRIGPYLTVQKQPRVPGRKTDVWLIRGRRGDLLGRVLWYSAWRQYVFEPAPSCVFNVGCLDDLRSYLKDVNEAHRQELQAAREQAQEGANG